MQFLWENRLNLVKFLDRLVLKTESEPNFGFLLTPNCILAIGLSCGNNSKKIFATVFFSRGCYMQGTRGV